MVGEPNRRSNRQSTAPKEMFMFVEFSLTTKRYLLDRIETGRPKFFCLNGGLEDYSDPRAPAILQMVQEFYNNYYPTPSSFELCNS